MSSALKNVPGYTAKTLTYKRTKRGHDILLDVAYPEQAGEKPATVLIHYHGGFLVVGDRYAFFPQWLVNACARRGWIFVTPDYRLLPESTGHEAVGDAADVHSWVLSSLSDFLQRPIGSVILAGASAGGYLALTSALVAKQKPAALLSLYGMLDIAGPRFTTSGATVFGGPSGDAAAVLQQFPGPQHGVDEVELSAHALSENPFGDPRFGFVDASVINKVFPDYVTGVNGMTRTIVEHGIEGIPQPQRHLFPLSHGDLGKLPRTMVVHGVNDQIVPAENSRLFVEKLKLAGVEYKEDFPEDGPHGFDLSGGNMDIETEEAQKLPGVKSMRQILRFLDDALAR